MYDNSFGVTVENGAGTVFYYGRVTSTNPPIGYAIFQLPMSSFSSNVASSLPGEVLAVQQSQMPSGTSFTSAAALQVRGSNIYFTSSTGIFVVKWR